MQDLYHQPYQPQEKECNGQQDRNSCNNKHAKLNHSTSNRSSTGLQRQRQKQGSTHSYSNKQLPTNSQHSTASIAEYSVRMFVGGCDVEVDFRADGSGFGPLPKLAQTTLSLKLDEHMPEKIIAYRCT